MLHDLTAEVNCVSTAALSHILTPLVEIDLGLGDLKSNARYRTILRFI